ncbi:DNA-directed RNA polymerase 1 and 3 subunit [Grosmannia clavigera kw1407]|uniref:DNA-directed RNA polymerases I and III subunit RPAC1 n=1 Tax=Grosmannia clavigera (strain kw1407 / UAMH 11150) TaxID=655863 RepID=F0XE51_GROCL|nr:DNA-directed RNA polymerase 1 and 3 subunit [Grosmannia clavigera kw1407]EFX04242.1 DNA-directed RNA polymerase 1 and 3 subunit [Grosmannia clavigera kw1407]
MAPIVKPTKEELERRQTVGVNYETVTNVSTTEFPGNYPGEDLAWDVDEFRNKLQIQFHQNEQFEASFSLIGVDASIANAFRRIMISEIPTVAIETAYIDNNTSVIQDEVLAHRLGLIPFTGGYDGLRNFIKWWKRPGPDADPNEFPPSFDYNTIKLKLQVECTRNRSAAPGETDPLKLYHNAHVYARDIEFVPEGNQPSVFSGENAIRPVNPDILVAKLRPGQAIDIEMHMHKGIGSDHAKFSPVCTASYRLLPTITILQPILGADAVKFASCFPDGVIGLEKVTRKDAAQDEAYVDHIGDDKAVVVDPMRDTVSRECLRHPEFQKKVKLGRRRDHFIYSIESTGQWNSDELFLESIRLLKIKCQKMEKQVMNMIR